VNKGITNFCVDFGIPVLILILCFALIWSGKDGEVKTVFAAAVGWLINSGVKHKKSS
jgi:hypothetical protein